MNRSVELADTLEMYLGLSDLKNPTGDSYLTRIIKNPSSSEIAKLNIDSRSSHFKSMVRFIVDIQSYNLYVFLADLLHSEAAGIIKSLDNLSDDIFKGNGLIIGSDIHVTYSVEDAFKIFDPYGVKYYVSSYNSYLDIARAVNRKCKWIQINPLKSDNFIKDTSNYIFSKKHRYL